MGFAPRGTNLLNNLTTGEAPTLSPAYGQYDDGAQVFPFYDNFAGTTLSSQWSAVENGGTISVDNGLSISNTANTLCGKSAVTEIDSQASSAQFTGPTVFDINFHPGQGNGPNFRFGFRDADLCDVQDGFSGHGVAVDFGDNGGSNDYTGGSSYSANVQITADNGGNGGTSGIDPGCTTACTLFATSLDASTGYNLFTIAATSASAQFYLNYEPTSPASISTSLPSYNSSIGIGIEQNYDTTPVNVGWVRTRAYPPNGVMPGVSFGATTRSQATSVFVPSGVLSYVPVTITNSQSSPTPAPFQQMVTVDSRNYSSLEASNLQNVEFFNFTGTVIPSWLESGNSAGADDTIYWLSLPDGIPANVSITVYMGFASQSDDLLNNVTTGEAPQLSPTYGQYDNGPHVFIDYWNFAGTSAPAGWVSTTDVQSVSYDNGVTIHLGDNVQAGVYYSIPGKTTNLVYDTLLTSYGQCTGGGCRARDVGIALTTTNGSSFYQRQFSFADAWYPNYHLVNGFSIWANSSLVAGNPNSLETPLVVSLSWSNGASHAEFGYSNGITNAKSLPNLSNADIALWDSNYFSPTYQWVRVRASPPNGLMPSVSFGALEKLIFSETVIFSETGLPAYTTWCVSLATNLKCGGLEDISFTEPSGLYRFSVAPVTGFESNPQNGSLNIQGSTADVSVAFSSSQPPPGITITVGVHPDAILYDPSNGYFYVADFGSAQVSVINGTAVIMTIPVGSGPDALAYDPSNGYVYVADFGSAQVSVINGTSVAATVSVGSQPDALVYDPAYNAVDVSNFGSNSISVVKGIVVNTTVAVGREPDALVFDPADQDVYAANYGSNSVSIINRSSLVVNVSVGQGPNAEVYNGANKCVYVTDGGSQQVSAICGVPNPGTPPPEISTSSGGWSIPTGPSGGGTIGWGGGGTIGCSGDCAVIPVPQNNTITVISPLWNIRAELVPIPPACGGGYSLALFLTPTTPFVAMFSSQQVGNIANSILSQVIGGSDGSLTYAINSSQVGALVTFLPTSYLDYTAIGNLRYIDDLMGAYSSAQDSVEIGGALGTIMGISEFTIPSLWNVPSDPFEVAYELANAEISTASYAQEVAMAAAYGADPSAFGAFIPNYMVGPGQEMVITIPGIQGSAADLPNLPLAVNSSFGYEPFAYAYFMNPLNPPEPGSIDQDTTVAVEGSPTLPYPSTATVTFNEVGLAPGTYWGVTADGANLNSTSDNIVDAGVTCGQFSYNVSAPDGYELSPSTPANLSMRVCIDRSIQIIFAPILQPVVFTETGLPQSNSWSVSIAGQSQTASTGSISFELANGGYNWAVGSPAGYVATPSSGHFVVDGEPVSEQIVFSLLPPPSQPLTVHTINVGIQPDAVTYDPYNCLVYVANYGSDTVSVIDQFSVVATVPVGSEPDALVFNGFNSFVYTANYGSDTVSVISGTSIVATVPVGIGPNSMAVDPTTGYVYVSNSGSNDVTIIANDQVLAQEAGTSLQPLTGSSGTGTCGGVSYVLDALSGAVNATAVGTYVSVSTTSVTCGSLAPEVGASTQCTAMVSGFYPTGTVAWSLSGSGSVALNLASCTLSSGECAVEITGISVGSATLGAAYEGNTGNAASNGTASIGVVPSLSGTVVSCSSPVTVGESSACTATVTGYHPSGNVSFTTSGIGTFLPDGTCTLNGEGVCSVSYVSGTSTESPQAVMASYSGDADNLASSGTTSITVNPAPTGTTVVCSPSTVILGAPSECVATVTDQSPTGTVTWSQAGGTGSVTISPMSCGLSSSLQCNVTVVGTRVGSVDMRASYEGDSDDYPSSGTFDLTVSYGETVACTPASVVVGRSTTCTATVTGATKPTGKVTWSTSGSGKFSPSVCTLKDGSCSVSYTPTSASSSVILTASYQGGKQNPSHSGTFGLVVSQTTSTLKLTCSPSSVVVGTSKTITCTAKLSGYLPTGSVTWSPSTPGLVSLSHSTCSLAKDTQTSSRCSVVLTVNDAGTFTMTAAYGGDSSNLGASGVSKSITIKQVKTSLSVSCVSSGTNTWTCTSTLSHFYGSVAGETVTWSQFSGKGTLSFSSTTCYMLSSGSCSVTVTGTSKGTTVIQAVFAGDQSNHGSKAGKSLKVTSG
jgi:YVTN family beta-propeller protein